MVKIIRVPRTPASAYNPKRAASSLLTAHVANLEAATRQHAYGKAARRPRTEAQASRYIAELTQELHPQAQPQVGAPPPPPAIQALAIKPAKKRARGLTKATGKSRKAARKTVRKRSRGRGRTK